MLNNLKEQRKKILLICDDLRLHSGVATVAREIVIHTAHHFDWVQLGGAIRHPDAGKKIDLSEEINKEASINDSSVILYPINDYGTPSLLRQMIDTEKPDALFLITDPRYFVWIFDMENEIRKKIPICYLNIWDSLPAPLYNQSYYESCDLLMGISKQTVQINKMVLDSGKIPWRDLDGPKYDITESQRSNEILIKYIPHGLNPNIYTPLPDNNKELIEFKKQILGEQETDFVLFFNSRNIRRKQISDSLVAFKLFLDSLPYEKALKCKFILHTEIISDHGTNLDAVKEYLFEEKYPDNVVFSLNKLSNQQLNYLYNIADAQILITSNEGWGLTLTEAMLAGTPIIANVQGGMQDQMRFEDKNGNWYTPSYEIPSNHTGTYTKHGQWAFPVYPTNLSLQGSPATPYIFDDRCSFTDVKKRIEELYNMSRKERKEKGTLGRQWAISDEAGFTCFHQAHRVIESLDTLFEIWKPREEFEIINTNEYKGKTINHSIIY